MKHPQNEQIYCFHFDFDCHQLDLNGVFWVFAGCGLW